MTDYQLYENLKKLSEEAEKIKKKLNLKDDIMRKAITNCLCVKLIMQNAKIIEKESKRFLKQYEVRKETIYG